MNGSKPSTAKGLNHDSEGSTEPSAPSPPTTLIRATMAKTARIETWKTISVRWKRAEISVPITHNAVMAAISATAVIVTTPFEGSSMPMML